MRIAALVAVILIVASCSSRIPAYPEVPTRGGDAVVSLGALSPGVPMFFSYSHERARVSFFVVLVDGDVEAYFNACETCHTKKKGYEFSDNRVLCNACDERYHIKNLKDGVGSCYPIRLQGRIEGAEYLLPLQELRARAYMF